MYIIIIAVCFCVILFVYLVVWRGVWWINKFPMTGAVTPNTHLPYSFEAQ
jgi:hypothetical protein